MAESTRFDATSLARVMRAKGDFLPVDAMELWVLDPEVDTDIRFRRMSLMYSKVDELLRRAGKTVEWRMENPMYSWLPFVGVTMRFLTEGTGQMISTPRGLVRIHVKGVEITPPPTSRPTIEPSGQSLARILLLVKYVVRVCN